MFNRDAWRLATKTPFANPDDSCFSSRIATRLASSAFEMPGKFTLVATTLPVIWTPVIWTPARSCTVTDVSLSLSRSR